jgi:hypothetical protein
MQDSNVTSIQLIKQLTAIETNISEAYKQLSNMENRKDSLIGLLEASGIKFEPGASKW